MSQISHYPSYDVMSQKEAWDEHTRQIVSSRLVREHGYRYLEPEEAEILRSCCSILVDDNRSEVIQYVVCHIDETLHQNIGEGERKIGVQPARILLREGLKALNSTAMLRFQANFFMLEENRQRQMLTELGDSELEPKHLWSGVSQKSLFQKLLSYTVESYYSHPQVWSEIGYGGPAYPRGYIRTAIGQLDPWEARKE